MPLSFRANPAGNVAAANAANLAGIRHIVYEDSNHNQYVFGTNAASNDFATLKYVPNTPGVGGAAPTATPLTQAALDAPTTKTYTDIARSFLEGGNGNTLLDNLIGIKAKTDTIPNTTEAMYNAVKNSSDAYLKHHIKGIAMQPILEITPDHNDTALTIS